MRHFNPLALARFVGMGIVGVACHSSPQVDSATTTGAAVEVRAPETGSSVGGGDLSAARSAPADETEQAYDALPDLSTAEGPSSSLPVDRRAQGADAGQVWTPAYVPASPPPETTRPPAPQSPTQSSASSSGGFQGTSFGDYNTNAPP